MKTAIYRFTEEARNLRGNDTWRKVELISGDPVTDNGVTATNIIAVVDGSPEPMAYIRGKVVPFKRFFTEPFKGLVEFEVWHGK